MSVLTYGLDYIKSKTGFTLVPIENTNNSVCYLITVVQRLRTNKKLNDIILRVDENESKYDKLIVMALKPLIYYKDIDNPRAERSTCLLQLAQSIQTLAQNYFKDPNSGYMPEEYISTFLLPCIYNICESDGEFEEILKNLFFDRDNASLNADYVKGAYYSVDSPKQLLKNEYLDSAFKLYCTLRDKFYSKYATGWKFADQSHPSCAWVLELFTEPTNPCKGHALSIIQDEKDEYYIIDDHRGFYKFSEYVKTHPEKLFKATVRDITNKQIDDLKKILMQHAPNLKIESLSTRFTFESVSGHIHGMAGGDLIDDVMTTESRLKYFVIISVLILALIISISSIISSFFTNQPKQHHKDLSFLQ